MYRSAVTRYGRVLSPALYTPPRRALIRPTRLAAVSPVCQKRWYASHGEPSSSDAFLQGSSSNYIEEMYEAWLKDPSSVHLSWQVYFKNMASGVSPGQAYTPPPTLVPSDSARLPSLPSDVISSSDGDVLDHMKIQLMVRAYQVRGHHIASLDPLQRQQADLKSEAPRELSYTYYGFTDKDLDRTFTIGPGILPAYGSKSSKKMTLREIIDHLKQIYCKRDGKGGRKR